MTTTPQTNTTLAAIAYALAQRDNFVICGHVNPDGDCLGSALALWHALRALGKTATCVLVKDEPIDENLTFLPGAEQLVAAEKFDGEVGTFVAVDVPTRERIGCAAELLDRASFSVTIDHHAADKNMTDLAYVDPDAASTTMLIWDLIGCVVEEPTRDMAVCAYTGLATDTGNFQFQNTDEAAFSAGGRMVAKGADPALVARHTMQNRSLASLRLEALVIERMRLEADGKVALSYITSADMEQTGAVKADTEPLVNVLRAVRGIEAACFLREQDGIVRGSLRAKSEFDVSAVARRFGGGGHKAAAGFTFEGTMQEALDMLSRTLAAAVGEAGGER